MDRKEFLSQLGLSAAGVVLFGCLGGCEKKEDSTPTPPSNVNLTIDLTNSTYVDLLTPGGTYKTSNGIIIAQTKTGSYIAVSEYCTHAGTAVQYFVNTNEFICPAHGSVFSATGTVKSGQANSALKQYTVAKSGTTLTITG